MRKIIARNRVWTQLKFATDMCEGGAHNWENGVNKTKNRRGAEEAR